jgi:DMSO reductase anchor subunit
MNFRRVEHKSSLSQLVKPRNKVSTPAVITNAQSALSEDIGSRQMRYLISMSIRTICFIATIFLPSPFRWVTLAAACILPYISVVVANAGREPNTEYRQPFNPNELN